MTAPVIAVHGLRKRFGPTTAVAELSLTVGPGEVFGFLGPNGAGKTTALKMLLGLLTPTAGGGTVLGAPLGDRRARARIGFLPEHFRFPDWLSGRELLRFHARLLGLARPRLEARLDELLARVDLGDAADRRLREYSKGMLQRIGLAQALVGEPELVFLDEPTSGLDPIGRRLVRDIIRERRAAGTAVFLNSHLLGEVEVTCDRVVFLKQGRAVRELSLAAAPPSLRVELRLGAADAEALAGLARLGSGFSHRDGLASLEVADEEALPGIARWLVERGVPLYELRAARKPLEAWFVEVMGDDQRPG